MQSSVRRHWVGLVGPLGHSGMPQRRSAAKCKMSAALELAFGGLYFRCRGVLNFGGLHVCCMRVLSNAQLAGVQNPDPVVQPGLRITTLTVPLIPTLTNCIPNHQAATVHHVKKNVITELRRANAI